MNMPAFGFTAPVVPVQIPVQQQIPNGFAPEQDLMGLATCDDFESGKDQLPVGEYTVVGAKVCRPVTRRYGKPFVFEYTVLESNNPDVAPGRQSSYFRPLVSKEDTTYLAQWLCVMLGAKTKEERLQVKMMQPFIVTAELTGQPCPVFDAVTRQPILGDNGQQAVVPPTGMLTGHNFHLSVTAPTEPSKNGKFYNKQVWTRL